MVDAFFTLETRKARLDLRDNHKFTELKDEDPSILVKIEDLSEKEREDVWELVSSYNRLGYVLHNYPKVFLFLSLKTRFLKWDAECVIDTWKRVRLYVYKEGIEKPERSEVGQEFEWLFNEAIKYQERKNRKKLKGNI